MAGQFKSALETSLQKAAETPSSTTDGGTPSSGAETKHPMEDRAEAPLDKEYLDGKIKLNKNFKGKADAKFPKKEAPADASPKAEEAKTDASKPEQQELFPDEGKQIDKRNDPEYLKEHNPERYKKLYKEDGTRKTITELATDRMEKAKQEAQKAKAELAQLKVEYEKAKQEKDVVTQKLVEREYQELRKRTAQEITQRFYEEAAEDLGDDLVPEYKELSTYYSSKLRENPKFEPLLKDYPDRHRMLMHLMRFIDSDVNPQLILQNLKNMDERVLARTLRQVHEELNKRAGDPKYAGTMYAKPQGKPNGEIPKPIVAETSGTDTEAPSLSPTASRAERLAHFRKYGKDLKAQLRESAAKL